MIPLSKLNPPALDERHVRRDRLITMLTQRGPVRLVVVRGPVGYGKSTLMSQSRSALREAGIATAWLTVDAADNDASRILASLSTAVAELRFGDPTAVAPLANLSPSDAVFAITQRMEAIAYPFVVFVDELEVIHSRGALAILEQFIERLPPGGRIVIGTRTAPELRIARLRVAEQLLEVDARDLRFSLAETRAFFEGRQARGLSANEIAALHDRTEGWPAATWLAWLALGREDRRPGFISTFSGTEAALATYLAEQVLSQQTARARRFLLRTSILPELSPSLCRALVPDEDVDDVLRELVQGDVFLVALEPNKRVWRYHKLVAGFLKAELQREYPTEVAALHLCAAEAFQRQGRLVPAIEHLIGGGHTSSAVALLESQAIDLLTQGRLSLLIRWFDALPVHALERSPTLRVTHAWAVSYTKGPQGSLDLLDRMRSATSDNFEVRAHVISIRCSLKVQLDLWDEAYTEGRKWLSSLPTTSRFAHAALVNSTATAAVVLGLFEEARRLVARAREEQATSQFHRMFSESVEGMIDLLEGRMVQAQARFRLALKTSQAASAHAGYGNAFAGLLYATSVYEAGDLARAKQLLQIYLPFARDAWLPDHTIIGLRQLSRIAFDDGDIAEAFERISELEQLGYERHLPRFVAAARLERAWVLLRQGHTDAADAELSLAAEAAPWSEIQTRRHLAHDWDDLNIALVRRDLFAGRGDAAKVRSDALLRLALAQKQSRRALKLRLLHAMACALLGESSAATGEMIDLLHEAAGEAAVRLFVDEGPMAAGLLIQVKKNGAMSDRLVATFAEQLLAGFHWVAIEDGSATSDANPAVQEPLTAKELRLVGLLAEGHSNKALSAKLFVSDSTVRTHLRSINLKLGASSRTQAVAIARRLGLVR